MHSRTGFVVVLALLTSRSAEAQPGLRLNGQVVDADTQAPLACRIYIQGADGTWHFAQSVSPSGSAVEYRKERGAASRRVQDGFHRHAGALLRYLCGRPKTIRWQASRAETRTKVHVMSNWFEELKRLVPNGD